MHTNDYDFVVIGAGVVGLSTAYHLTNSGAKTVVLEQFPFPHCRGSSHGHSRIIRHAYEKEYYTQMMTEAFPLWHKLEEEINEKLIIGVGLLDMCCHGDPKVDSIANNLAKFAVPHERLSKSEILHRYPMFDMQGEVSGVLDKTGGIILADKAIQGLYKCIIHRGGELHENVKVMKIQSEPGIQVIITTNKGTYKAQKIVITPGAWASQLLSDLDLYLPFKIIKTTSSYWRETKPGTHSFDKIPGFIDDTALDKNHVYFVPSYEYPGLVKCSYHAGTPTLPDTRDYSDNAESTRRVSEYLRKNLPFIDSSKPAIIESCMYTETPDANCVLDYHPRKKNIVIGAGFSGHGFKLAIVVGKILALMAQDREPGYDLTPFSIKRFGPVKSNL